MTKSVINGNNVVSNAINGPPKLEILAQNSKPSSLDVSG